MARKIIGYLYLDDHIVLLHITRLVVDLRNIKLFNRHTISWCLLQLQKFPAPLHTDFLAAPVCTTSVGKQHLLSTLICTAPVFTLRPQHNTTTMADNLCGPSAPTKGLLGHLDRNRAVQQDRIVASSPAPAGTVSPPHLTICYFFTFTHLLLTPDFLTFFVRARAN